MMARVDSVDRRLVKRKLIEVALPLEAINRESAREKSIRSGHPATLHLWWARRPLAACRAVLFAQLVDDPSSHPDRFPTEELQSKERLRLFEIIERLVVWENSTDEGLLGEAHREIAASFGGVPPAVLDPFAGGGSIPLEAQRLGLEAHSTDLNPVAVLISKALIVIPPAWRAHKPVHPKASRDRIGGWSAARGLAEDVRLYGEWIRDQAVRRIGGFYPQATLADKSKATVTAWIWARTVRCSNPACGVSMPLVRSFWLCKKAERPAWVKPHVDGKTISFEVVADKGGPSAEGTVGRLGATCIACSAPVSLNYIRAEGKEGRIGAMPMALIVDGQRQRLYLSPSTDQLSAADVPEPADVPETQLPHNPRDFKTPNYGMRTFASLFTRRQLLALTTFSDLVAESVNEIVRDARAAGMDEPAAAAYATAVTTYLGLAVGRCSDYNSSICTWHSGRETIRNTFARQAVPMTWDFVEANILGNTTGNWTGQINWIAQVIASLPAAAVAGTAEQRDAAHLGALPAVISTDPPYYDNIGYADLSDFFYVWLRRSLRPSYPDLFATIQTPKTEELVATPYRFGGDKSAADRHFEDGFVKTFRLMRASHPPDVPITVYYAVKQSEADEHGVASTGWETMLSGLIDAGFSVTATWPVRSELSNRMLASGTNALASSIVLACRPLRAEAEATTRRGFIQALHAELPKALRELQQGSIAPVDLAQAAVGPGMAVFTRYRTVVEADGSAMSVRTALALINQALDEVLSEQEGDFDSDTRFCLKWFTNYGWNEAESGTADTLARATNSSLAGLDRAGVFKARAGRARLLAPDDLSPDWDPTTDERISVWEVVVRVAHALEKRGTDEAGRLLGLAGRRVDLDTAKELAYLLFSVCERRGWTASALLFNGLGTSWADLTAATKRSAGRPRMSQTALSLDVEEE